jgi:hypothetical protein
MSVLNLRHTPYEMPPVFWDQSGLPAVNTGVPVDVRVVSIVGEEILLELEETQ